MDVVTIISVVVAVLGVVAGFAGILVGHGKNKAVLERHEKEIEG